MTAVTITMPDQLDPQGALVFASKLDQYPEASSITLDFTNTSWFEPFGMLYVASAMKSYLKQKPHVRVFAQNYHDKTYAIHMGLMKHCGIAGGRRRLFRTDSDTYSPIAEISLTSLQRRADSNYTVVQEEIESAAVNLASLLVERSDEPTLWETVQYSIREIGRNIVEHSESSNILYCGQYWPSKNKVEVCMTDSGIGLLDTLRENPYIDVCDDKEAVQAAILPGISGKVISNSPHHDDRWANSGFGLYMLSRLCAEGGSFFLVSGASGVLINSGEKHIVETRFAGTAVRLVLNTESISNGDDLLDRFGKEGQVIAKKLTGGAIVGPSVASSTLRRAFNIKTS